MEIEELELPKIDIARITHYGENPIDIVKRMDPKDFECFTSEWLFNRDYIKIGVVGGSGDGGRDVIAQSEDGSFDIYQCKHVNSIFSEVGKEVLKLLKNVHDQIYVMPRKYCFVCLNGISNKWRDAIDFKKLREVWIKWFNDGGKKSNADLMFEGIDDYVKNFDFNVVTYEFIESVIDEHLRTPYGKFRFGPECKIDKIVPPPVISEEENVYVDELMKAYSDIEKNEVSENNIDLYPKYKRHFERQREAFFSAVSVYEAVYDIFIDLSEFNCLKKEIYDGIIDVVEKKYDNGYECLSTVLSHVTMVNTSKCKLDSIYHIIGNEERKGVCHMLVNDRLISWCDNEQSNL